MSSATFFLSTKLLALSVWHDAVLMWLTIFHSTGFLASQPLTESTILFIGNITVFPLSPPFQKSAMFKKMTNILLLQRHNVCHNFITYDNPINKLRCI